MRYDSCGDYFPNADGSWEFRISDMKNADFEMLVALHELVEWWWAQRKGIPNAAIDRFDMKYEADRLKGKHGKDEEPGDDLFCPVYEGHQIGCGVERMLAAALGISWTEYERAFDRLPKWLPKWPKRKR